MDECGLKNKKIKMLVKNVWNYENTKERQTISGVNITFFY